MPSLDVTLHRIAGLLAFLGRKGDGKPGVKSLWIVPQCPASCVQGLRPQKRLNQWERRKPCALERGTFTGERTPFFSGRFIGARTTEGSRTCSPFPSRPDGQGKEPMLRRVGCWAPPPGSAGLPVLVIWRPECFCDAPFHERHRIRSM